MFNMFVSNKIAGFQQLTRGMDWRYVPTEMKPADILSKGVAPQDLLHSRLWMNGPTFLQGERSCSPEINLPEIRQRILLSFERADISLSFKHIIVIIKRIFGYVQKFISRTKTPDLSHVSHRSTAYLYPEYLAVRKGNCVQSSSSST